MLSRQKITLLYKTLTVKLFRDMQQWTAIDCKTEIIIMIEFNYFFQDAE